MRRFAWFLGVVCLAVAGCGDDENILRDGAPNDAPPGNDGGGIEGMFDMPSDFEHIDCTAGSLAGFDPVGIWHQDVLIAGIGTGYGAHRYDRDGSGNLTALLNGREATVTLTADDLFARSVYMNGNGDVRVRTYDACRLEPDGSVSGYFAGCNAENTPACYQGTFTSVKVERLPGEAESQGLTLLSEFAGSPSAPWTDSALSVNVRVQDGIAYLANYFDGLRIVDVTDPAAPVELGWSPVVQPEFGELYNDVKIVNDGPKTYALMASDTRGIVSIDVTDPAAPVEVATFPPVPEGEPYVGVHTLAVETIGPQTRAYLANTTIVGLQVYDVTDPSQPQQIGEFIHPEVATDYGAYLHDLYVEDGLAYLDYWSLGLVIVDANDPANIVEVGRFNDYMRRTNHSNWVTTAGGRKVSLTGDEDFSAHLRVIDVDPASPAYMTKIGELQLRPEVSIHNIMAFGNTAYISWYQDGIRILDLSDPTNPTLAGWFNTWDGRLGHSFFEGATGLDVDLAAGLIYVADIPRGLMVLRIE